jgi:CRISPR-associated protein Csd2
VSALQNRFDFVMLFDVQDGNPNGDPDAGNLPRIDPQTNQGLVTDVCLKRKVRNYVLAAKSRAPGFDIFVKEKAVLNELIEESWDAANKGAKMSSKAEKEGGLERTRARMCESYFDIRAFGAVLSTGKEKEDESASDKKFRKTGGQVRGPVQFTFGRSIDPILPHEHSITRMAVTTAEKSEELSGDNRTMGRKNTVPYGLYVAHGFISPQFAKQTGFSTDDLEVLWGSLRTMFELDRSAARGLMSMRRAIVFKHESELGDSPAHKLFELVKVARKPNVSVARAFTDYDVSVGQPPARISMLELV